MIITIFEEKHSDTLSQQRLNGLLNIVPDDMKFDKPDSLPASFQDSINKLISWDAFAFIYYNPVAEKFSISKVVNNTSLKYAGENLDIEISGTLTGKSIVTGMPVKIDDTSQEKYIRFSKIEDVSFDGSFLAIPLVYNGQNFGVLCFESLKKNAYTNNDVQFIKSATNIFSFIVYSYSTHSLLKSYLAVDIETKALNDITFRERLANDLAKAEIFNAPGALALIRIDEFIEQESLFDGDPFPKVLEAVSDIISKEMTHLNLFGRLDDKTFGVYFFNESAKNVFIWAEKLRVKIARQPVAVVSKQTTYTVSIGVAAATGKSPSEVITNAELALNKALEKGGNTVRNLN
jgi:diguanylate cyclase (GGDEF)-like protein